MRTWVRSLFAALVSAQFSSAAISATGGSFGCGFNDIDFDTVTCGVTSITGPVTHFGGSYSYTFNGAVARGGSMLGAYRADYGDVGIALTASAFVYDQFSTRGRASALGGWTEAITIESDTLPDGTPIYIDVTHSVDADASVTTKLVDSSSVASISTFFDASFNFNAPSAPVGQFTREVLLPGESSLHTNRTVQFAAVVGETVQISYSMEAYIDYFLSQPAVNTTEASSFSSVISAQNSGHIYMSASTSDFWFTSASGHDYSPTTVPEPSSMLLMVVGAICLAGAGSRRARPTPKRVYPGSLKLATSAASPTA